MTTAHEKPEQPDQAPRRNVGRVMRRLLAAVDRSITAAEDARKARDELVRLATVKGDITR